MVRFYASGTTTMVAISDVTIRGIDAPGDSVLVDGETIDEVYLPLRATVGTTQWEFCYGGVGSELVDTLTLKYKPIPYFASAECGAMYNFELTSVAMTTHVADSVAVAKTIIDNGLDVAIRIFYTANNE